jgi:hypothetical protein
MRGGRVRTLAALVVSVLLAASAAVAALAGSFTSEPLTITTATGTNHTFSVEIAATPDERAEGLMNRRDMASDHGMLFDFGMTRRVAMWMKNTYLPLDMLFILEDGTVSRIEAGTVPESETIIDSGGPVRFVLEVNGGVAASLGIRPGDRVRSATIESAVADP